MLAIQARHSLLPVVPRRQAVALPAEFDAQLF
jgi:hypothetical protein